MALHTLHDIFSDMFLHIIEMAILFDSVYGICNFWMSKFQQVVIFLNIFFNFFLQYVDFVDVN